MTRKTKLPLVAAALTACAIGMAACSSSPSTSSAASTTPAAVSSTSSGQDSQLSAIKQEVAQAEQAPTKIPLTTPLKAKPPTGKTFVWMNCDQSSCAGIGAGVKAAALAAGWNFKEFAVEQAEPSTLVAAMKQALQLHPAAVGLTGLPEAVWGSVIPAYQAAGVPIITGWVGAETLTSTIVANVANQDDMTALGKTLANWFVADSDGKGHALVVEVSTFPILGEAGDSFTNTVKSECSGCQTDVLQETIANVENGTVVPSVVAQLRQHPDINYVCSMNGSFIEGLPSQLAAAGLTGKVKIASLFGGVENLADVKAGTEAATIGTEEHYSGWLMVDAAIRHAEGMSIPDGDGGLPSQLVTAQSGGTFPVAESFDVPSNFASQFEALWGLG